MLNSAREGDFLFISLENRSAGSSALYLIFPAAVEIEPNSNPEGSDGGLANERSSQAIDTDDKPDESEGQESF